MTNGFVLLAGVNLSLFMMFWTWKMIEGFLKHLIVLDL